MIARARTQFPLPPFRWHPRYPSYGLDARGRPVSRRVTRGPRLLHPERHNGEPRIALRWSGITIKIRLIEFERQCKESSR